MTKKNRKQQDNGGLSKEKNEKRKRRREPKKERNKWKSRESGGKRKEERKTNKKRRRGEIETTGTGIERQCLLLMLPAGSHHPEPVNSLADHLLICQVQEVTEERHPVVMTPPFVRLNPCERGNVSHHLVLVLVRRRHVLGDVSFLDLHPCPDLHQQVLVADEDALLQSHLLVLPRSRGGKKRTAEIISETEMMRDIEKSLKEGHRRR